VDVPAARFRYFSQTLAEQGYYNAYFGKWHVEQSNRLEDFGWHEYLLRDCHGAGLKPSDPADWQDAYAEFFGQRFVYTQRITWHEEWKYVFNPGGIDELYNLRADPQERVNRANDLACREVLEEMCRRMWRKMAAIGDDSLYNTQYATLRTAPVGPNR